MKKLLQINSVVNYGSTGHIVEDLGNLAQQNGFESYVIYGRKRRKSSQKTYYIGSLFAFLFHVFMTFITDGHGLYSKFATRKLIKLIQKINPDVIHLHNIHGYYLNYPLLFNYFKKIDKPIIWTLHDCWTYTGHCSHYTFVKCSDWKIKCLKCKQKRSYPPSLLIDNCRKNFELKKMLFTSVKNCTIVTPSKWLSKEVGNSFFNRYTIKYIYNGIDLDKFRSSSNNPYTFTNKKIILSVANVWDDRKGFNDLIELNKLLDHNLYQIVMIGLTKKQVKKLPENIIGIERTESVQELVDYYSFADVYFCASVEETLGMTPIEAQACGTPCIVYNSTAIPETILNGKTGVVVEPRDIVSVMDSINLLVSKDRSSMAKQCTEWVRSNFDINVTYKKYLEIYQNVLK